MIDGEKVSGTAGLTIGELAGRTGMTVRNIRAYQARGILPPPEVRGRVGYYSEAHVARLDLARRFREQGFNLGAIAALVSRGEDYLEQVAALRRELEHAAADDGWVPMTQEEYDLSEAARPGSIAAFIRLGTIRVEPDGTMLNDPRIAESGWVLNRAGLSPGEIIDLLIATGRLVRRMSEAYVGLVRQRAAALAEADAAEAVAAMREAYDVFTPTAIEIMTQMVEVVLRTEAPAAMERALRSIDVER